MNVLGIDPGGATTAFVTVDTAGPTVEAVTLVDRKRSESEDGYLDACATILRTHLAGPVELAAVEGLVHPNPHLGLANVAGLIDTATVRGYLLAVLAGRPMFEVVHVRPGRHGSAPRAAYPPALIGPREGPRLSGRLRHARSAFDVALTGAKLSRHPELDVR